MSLLDKASLIVTPNAYKESKLYSVVPSSGAGDMDVVRATTATRVNSAGLIEIVSVNVPRIDYTNGSCPSLLVEPQRTNLLTYSNDFADVSWAKYGTSIEANSIISPDGTQNASKLNVTTLNFCNIAKSGNLVSNKYTNSVFAKKGNKDWLIIFDLLGNGGTAWFNISNGTLGTVSNGTATIKSYGNGWYKCTYSNTANIINSAFIMSFVDSNNSTMPTSNGFSYIYGAQLEAGTYPTSYIPTVASSVTRNADVISKTGISSLIGQTEGTVFIDCIINGKVLSSNVINSEKNTDCSFYILSEFNNNIQASLFISGNPKARITGGNIAVGQRAKIAYVYKTGASKLYINGALIGTNTDTFTLPSTFDDIFFNDLTTYFSYNESVTYNSVQFYKTALTNTELAQLTTL